MFMGHPQHFESDTFPTMFKLDYLRKYSMISTWQTRKSLGLPASTRPEAPPSRVDAALDSEFWDMGTVVGPPSNLPIILHYSFVVPQVAWKHALTPNPYASLTASHPRIRMLAEQVKPTADVIFLQNNWYQTHPYRPLFSFLLSAYVCWSME
jgi:hypothetical protein